MKTFLNKPKFILMIINKGLFHIDIMYDNKEPVSNAALKVAADSVNVALLTMDEDDIIDWQRQLDKESPEMVLSAIGNNYIKRSGFKSIYCVVKLHQNIEIVNLEQVKKHDDDIEIRKFNALFWTILFFLLIAVGIGFFVRECSTGR